MKKITKQKLKKVIERLVEQKLNEKFMIGSVEYQTGEISEGEIRSIADSIARQVKWDGFDVIAIFLQTLTECNFHSERKKFEAVAEKIMMEDE